MKRKKTKITGLLIAVVILFSAIQPALVNAEALTNGMVECTEEGDENFDAAETAPDTDAVRTAEAGIVEEAAELAGETEITEEPEAAEAVPTDGVPTEAVPAEVTVAEEVMAEEVMAEEVMAEDTEVPLTEELQACIDGLPTMREYAAMSLEEQEAVDGYVDELKSSYYEDMDNGQRAEVDMAQMAALDIYADTLIYNGPDSEEGIEEKERDIVILSDSELSALQDRIDALPLLEDIVDVSSILPEEASGKETGKVLRYSADSTEMYIPDKEVDLLYEEIYDIAAAYFSLGDAQAIRISDADKIMNLTGFFSVGMEAYRKSEHTPSKKAEAEIPVLSSILGLLKSAFVETVYAATANYGTLSGYEHLTYSGSYSTHHWICGYYEITSGNTSPEGTVAFCTNSKQDSPGREPGIVMTTQSEGTDDVIKCLLYYGYGGPGQVSKIKSNRNGYIETHYAISWYNRGKPSAQAVDTFGKDCYNMIYGGLTAEQKKLAIECTDYWLTGTGVSGTQKLAYARFHELPEEPEPETETALSMKLQKYDADTKLPEPQGSTTFAGAIFELAHCGAEDTEQKDKTWYFRTDEKGSIDFTDPTYLIDEYTFRMNYSDASCIGETIHSDPLKYSEEHQLLLEAGAYTIKEVCPPSLYRLEGTMCLEGSAKSCEVTEGLQFMLANDTDGKLKIYDADGVELNGSLAVNVYDKAHLNTLSVTKSGRDKAPLAGVSYKLVRSSDGYEYDSITTGSDGTAAWKDLPSGEYLLTEIKTADGYELLAENIRVTLPCQMTAEEIGETGADIDRAYFDEVSGRYCFDYANFDIIDAVTFDMPMTGGSHSMLYLYLICGMLLIVQGVFSLRNRFLK